MDKSGGEPREGGSSSIPSTSSSSSAAAGPAPGCGSSSGSALTTNPLTLNVTTTTGGNFSVIVDSENSVENLKKIISKKLKVSKDRICLLHRERELNDGTLRENGLMDGSKLILTPNVETGLLAQRAENTVMQALESLNDNQVNDFLSGKSPLNLSVRLGDHMMLIQLQLSTLNPASQNGSRSKAHKSRAAISATGSTGGTHAASASSSSSLIPSSPSRSHTTSRTAIPIGFRKLMTASDGVPTAAHPIMEHVNEGQTLTKQEIDSIHNIVKNLTESNSSSVVAVTPAAQDEMETDSPVKSSTSESPIKSLSNLVSSSIDSSIPPATNNNSISSGPPSPCADPISANLTSCLCRRLDNNDNNSCDPNCLIRTPETSQPSTSSTGLHRTAHNPIARHKAKIQTFRKYISFDGGSTALPKPEQETLPPTGTQSAPNSPQRLEQSQLHHLPHGYHYQHQRHLSGQSSSQVNLQPTPSSSNSSSSGTIHARLPNTDPSGVENPALAEASRNLTQTLRKLSKRVFTKTANDSTQESTGKSVSSGAVIESMKHHGKGIYSGTFSGTLNPALQDKFGRPKRDISTIIHILNDLLSAAPQCARSGTKIYFEPSQPATASTTAPGTSASTSTATTTTSSSSSGAASVDNISGGGGSSSCSSSSGSSSSTSSSNGSNSLQSAAAMAPPTAVATSSTSFTTPIAAPSPRLVTRCVPTPIQTKKYPSSGSTVTFAGPSSVAGCNSCKPINSATLPMTSSASYGRCHHQQKMTVPKTLCKCGLPLTPTASPNSQQQCQRCAAISAAALENSKTKSKLDNLRLIMQQKKERREARKQKCAPYSTALSTASATNPAGGSGSSLEPARSAHRQLAAVTASTNTGAVAVETMDTTPPSSAATESSKPRAAAADITASAVEATSSTTSSGNGSNNAATATATATTTTTSATAAAAAAAATAGATSSETTAQSSSSHQLVEEVDTVA